MMELVDSVALEATWLAVPLRVRLPPTARPHMKVGMRKRNMWGKPKKRATGKTPKKPQGRPNRLIIEGNWKKPAQGGQETET